MNRRLSRARRRIADLLIVSTLVVIAWGTLLPGEDATRHISPFCLLCGEVGAVDLVLNVLLFLPLGLGLALRGVPARRALLGLAALTCAIELWQAFVITGRHASLRDLVTNAAGGALGFALGARWRAIVAPSRREGALLIVAIGTIWLAVQALGAASFRPTFSDEEHFGQPQYPYRQWPPFTGRLLGAQVMDIPLPDATYDDWRAFRARLMEGPILVEAAVIPGRWQWDYAPFARVVASGLESIALAQRGSDLVFSVRTLAVDLRLRPARFLLPGAFPVDPSAGDTLFIRASYDGGEARLLARRGSLTVERTIAPSASLGWALLLPTRQGYIGSPGFRVGTALYLLVLLAPLGYWLHACAGSGTGTRSRRTVAILLGATLIAIGLALLPRLFGLRVSPPEEWVAAALALALGALLFHRARRFSLQP